MAAAATTTTAHFDPEAQFSALMRSSPLAHREFGAAGAGVLSSALPSSAFTGQGLGATGAGAERPLHGNVNNGKMSYIHVAANKNKSTLSSSTVLRSMQMLVLGTTDGRILLTK